MNKRYNNYRKIMLCELIASLLFCLFNISFSFDISLLAFPISIVFTVILGYLHFIKLVKKGDGSFAPAVSKMNEYLPYLNLLVFILRRAGKEGVPYFVDVIQVILWVIFTVSAFINGKYLKQKNIELISSEWRIKPVYKKYKGFGKVIYELVDWVDAIVWAIFTVLLVQLFVFQLYEIPSESMVDTFLVKDRVIVSKYDCGPKFPLTDVGLPTIKKYKKGDVVVLRNPHYRIDRKSEVKTVVSQIISMLTLTTVNLNTDENGQLKADPLVKRIVGQPGEQLVMQDGVLYYRTKEDNTFIPSKTDEKFANWDLNTLSPKIKQKIEYFPITQQEYEIMLDFEQQRRDYDLNVAEFKVKEIVNSLYKLRDDSKLQGNFEITNLFEYELFNNVQNIAQNILMQKGGVEWFEQFLLSWIPSKNVAKDIYAESNYKLNVMSKVTFGNLVLRYAQLIKNEVSVSSWASDVVLSENLDLANKLNWYIQGLLDVRNMPVFPANDAEGNPQYLPEKCFFMMGDNRFNSLDLRHSMEQTKKPLSTYDKMSVEYYSMMVPQYINQKYIIGSPIYKFWPLGRQGFVK